jgi:ribosomal protein S18 acetylase RimI-like enzyme
VLVAELDGDIVGTLIALSDGWRGNMYRLAVLPRYRRRGIARALVDEGERRLRSHGCARVTALVMHEHTWAVEFWHAARYDHDERTVRFVHTLT